MLGQGFSGTYSSSAVATTSRNNPNDDERIEEGMPEFLRISPSDIKIGDQIGRGGFSTVHKASWRRKRCAAKIVQTANVLAIQKEVAILSKLSHPNIMGCIGFSVDTSGDPSRCMILMELMESDLRHLINERLKNKTENALPFSEKQAVHILKQIATGMEYLHGQGVFHGDLKASNVLVSHGRGGKIHVKITDFGVSQMVKLDPEETPENFVSKKYFHGAVGTRGYQAPEISSSSMMCSKLGRNGVGTAHFRAPELYEFLEDRDRKPQRNPEEFYTAKADIYCFAMTCYEILSGRIPFEIVRKPDIPALVLQGVRPVLPHGLNQRFGILTTACWHQKPSRRPKFSDIRRLLETWDQSTHELWFMNQSLPEKGSKDQRSQYSCSKDQSKAQSKCWGRLLRRSRRGKWK